MQGSAKVQGPPHLQTLAGAWVESEGLELLPAAWRSRLTDRILLVSSFGIESTVLLDMAASIGRHFPVLFLDTGWHFPETLRCRNELVDRPGVTNVRTLTPDPAGLARHDADGALCRRDPDFCCHPRKTER